MKKILLVIVLLCFGGKENATASLLGDSITGRLIYPSPGSTIVQFDPPSTIVSSGVEFFGKWLVSVGLYDMAWDVEVDVQSDRFTVGFFENTDGVNNLSSDPVPFIGIELSELSWNGMSDRIIGVQMVEGGPGVNSMSFTSSSIIVLWDKFPFGAGNNLPNGGTWSFSITGKQEPVPEPTTMLLFGAGFAGLAAMGRKRKVGSSKAE